MVCPAQSQPTAASLASVSRQEVAERSAARKSALSDSSPHAVCLFMTHSSPQTGSSFFREEGGKEQEGGGRREQGRGREGGEAGSTINNEAAESPRREERRGAQDPDAGPGTPGRPARGSTLPIPALLRPTRPVATSRRRGWSSGNWILAVSSQLPAPNRGAR